MDVIKLLRSKNRCLMRLDALCARFLEQNDQNQLPNQFPNQFNDQLDAFQRERNAIFRTFELYDRMITKTIVELPQDQRTKALASEVQIHLDTKDSLIQSIILKDNELMARIERKKNALMEEATQARKNSDLVGKFKSSWVADSGEGLDQKL